MRYLDFLKQKRPPETVGRDCARDVAQHGQTIARANAVLAEIYDIELARIRTARRRGRRAAGEPISKIG